MQMSSSETDQIDRSSDLPRRLDAAIAICPDPGLSLAPTRAFAKALTLPVSEFTDWQGGIGDSVDEIQTKARLDGMRIEHRDLDDAIAALASMTVPDQLQMARLKKRKLRLRDEIAAREDLLIPDIIA